MTKFRELCREFGISRKTGYKWLERFHERGLEGLVDQSTRPQSSPGRTTSEIAVEIIRLLNPSQRIDVAVQANIVAAGYGH